MYAKEGVIDDAGEGEEVERLHHQIIDFLRVFETAFCSEIVLGGHDAGLVIAPQH